MEIVGDASRCNVLYSKGSLRRVFCRRTFFRTSRCSCNWWFHCCDFLALLVDAVEVAMSSLSFVTL